MSVDQQESSPTPQIEALHSLDPSMACKGSGVQIPSAPPQVSGPLRRRPLANPGPRAADTQQRPCVADALVQCGGHPGHHRRGRLPVDPPHRAAAGTRRPRTKARSKSNSSQVAVRCLPASVSLCCSRGGRIRSDHVITADPHRTLRLWPTTTRTGRPPNAAGRWPKPALDISAADAWAVGSPAPDPGGSMRHQCEPQDAAERQCESDHQHPHDLHRHSSFARSAPPVVLVERRAEAGQGCLLAKAGRACSLICRTVGCDLSHRGVARAGPRPRRGCGDASAPWPPMSCRGVPIWSPSGRAAVG
jgi:hypothetical protein